MPIIVKDFTWTQTETTVHIRIPLNPGKHDKVDLFTTDSYIKAHFKPFLFEVFLRYDVNISKSKCIINDDEITLDLLKNNEEQWDGLEKNLSKEEKKVLRDEVYKKSQERAKEDAENRSIKKSQLDRFTVQRAMDLDTKQHALMDSRRDHERYQAMNALEEWRQQTNKNDYDVNESGVKITEMSENEPVKVKISTEKAQSKVRPQATTPRTPLKTPVKSEFVEKKKKEAATRVLPKLRQTAHLEITHTPRSFPTPSRESTAEEEQTWLKNITMARRATGFVSEDLRPEEQDPQWCKEKGDEFFRNGNFLGAISAYTHGIKLSAKLPSLYSNRAATHFALGNFNKCVNDCSTALDLLKPACEGNRKSRARCIARRAAALARLGYLNKAIEEMKAASRLIPDDQKIKKDIYDMERAWEQNPDSD
ncbi:dynein axonemal assembly factor 4 [Bombyx mori]|uniref:CS domain-containing protein n=1 Tax=Bombyx mori TaxID=7091 RepID=A0A8R1WQT8_BOMMO|nr:dynein assembly factor 4, axonemal [Bombyx mori]